MAWIEIHIDTEAAHAEALSDALTELGASAITLRDAGDAPVYEPAPGETPVWLKTTLVSLFTSTDDLTPIYAFLDTQKQQGVLSTYTTLALADQEWERVCLQDFKPLQFGKRLWVCPSWETPPDPAGITVILDPGLAFGTGTSPTTALCLAWLDEHCVPGSTVIDYGCGSGILALAALKLGAKKVLAVDYDPQAILATKDNGARNHLHEPELEVALPENFHTDPVDLVMANILAKSLIELAETLAAYTKLQGRILLSGILREQVDTVIAAYETWFTLDETNYQGEWAQLSGTKHHL